MLENKGVGIIYDTANEERLKEGKVPLLVRQAWEPYVDVLSEPVAVVGWDEGVSTWEIFFATNRMPESGLLNKTERFGADPASRPIYGRAEVVLPKRGRGVDPPLEQPRNRWVSWLSFKKPVEDADLARFNDIERTGSASFLAGVNRQLARSRQKDLLLFVHGFNVQFEPALVRAAQIALDVPFNGAVVAYSWPTQGGISNYQSDEPLNAASVRPFAEFLTTLLNGVEEGTRVSILVHSMGNRIVMKGINQLPEDARLEHVVLCAPDVGVSQFRALAPGVVARSERVTLYASQLDAALTVSKGLNAEQRAGDADPPLVIEGVETIDCTAVDYMSLMGHSYYGANRQVLGDLYLLLKEHRMAARRPHLQELETDAGSYWEFVGNSPNVLVTWHFKHLQPGYREEVQTPPEAPLQTADASSELEMDTPGKQE